jgi:hypothetical protein
MGAKPTITALKAADQILDRYEAELSRCCSENDYAQAMTFMSLRVNRCMCGSSVLLGSAGKAT